LPILGAKRVDFLLELFVLPLRLLEHPLPIAGLLTQLGNLTPQFGYLAEQLFNQGRKFRFPSGAANRLIRILKQRGIHHSHAIPKPANFFQINSRPGAPPETGWANTYGVLFVNPSETWN